MNYKTATKVMKTAMKATKAMKAKKAMKKVKSSSNCLGTIITNPNASN